MTKVRGLKHTDVMLSTILANELCRSLPVVNYSTSSQEYLIRIAAPARMNVSESTAS